jgi:hypothetical protein
MFWETQKLWKPTFFFLCGVLKSEPTQKNCQNSSVCAEVDSIGRSSKTLTKEITNGIQLAWCADGYGESMISNPGKSEFRLGEIQSSGIPLSQVGKLLLLRSGARSVDLFFFLSRGHTKRQAGAHSLRWRGKKPASRITYPNTFPIRFPHVPSAL